jgi:hypothetical protein
MQAQNTDGLIKNLVWCSRSIESSKICPVCKARSGKARTEIAQLKDGHPIDPPIHDGCVCVWIPKVKEWYELLPPELQAIGKAKAMSNDERAGKTKVSKQRGKTK